MTSTAGDDKQHEHAADVEKEEGKGGKGDGE
jgi:hypothetical protein